MSKRISKRREFCDCGEPTVIGHWQQATCMRCHLIQQWLTENQWLFTNRITEEQREKSVERGREVQRNKRHHFHKQLNRLVAGEEPEPVAPPNTLFHIVGYKHYFIVDKYASQHEAA